MIIIIIIIVPYNEPELRVINITPSSSAFIIFSGGRCQKINMTKQYVTIQTDMRSFIIQNVISGSFFPCLLL